MREQQVADEVILVLEQMEFKGNVAIFPKSMGQLERKLYEAVDDVLTRLGGKWKKGKGHIFEYEPEAAIKAVCSTGLAPAKNPHAYFPTPKGLAEKMCDAAELEDLYGDYRILEPSAGCGGIVSVLAERGFKNVDCVEFDPINAAVLRKAGWSVDQGDFLLYQPEKKYDRILMNPPFAVESDKLAYVAHIEHAWSMLADGGILVAICPNGITYRGDKRTARLRELVVDHAGTLEDIPAGTFKSSGTMIGTTMIKIKKEDPSWKYLPTNGFKSWIVWVARLYMDNYTPEWQYRYYQEVLSGESEPNRDVVLNLYKALEQDLRRDKIFDFTFKSMRSEDIDELYELAVQEWRLEREYLANKVAEEAKGKKKAA